MMEKSIRSKEVITGGVVRRMGLVSLFITCLLLLTIVFMAVPRVSNQGEAYFGKQIHYNHGADRDPHLGQRTRAIDASSRTKSRKLLENPQSSLSARFR